MGTAIRDKIKNEELYHKDDNAKRYDDIWILRYALSYKDDIEGATKAAVQTMIFRDEKKLNREDLRHRIQNFGDVEDQKLFNSSSSEKWEPLPGWEKMNECVDENTGFFVQPDLNKGVLTIFDLGKVDMDLASKTISQD